MKRFWIIVLWPLSLLVAFFAADYRALNRDTVVHTDYGRFLSRPKVEILENGRDVQLLEDFVFVDPNEKAWLAPGGSVVDGASIPRKFWSWMGGPLSGKYRNASIVHDTECDARLNDDAAVHLMFYHACLAGGVPEDKAKRLYWAVSRFGPRWEFESRTKTVQIERDGKIVAYEVAYSTSVPMNVTLPTDEDVAWAEDFFANNNVDAAIIPKLGPISPKTGTEDSTTDDELLAPPPADPGLDG